MLLSGISVFQFQIPGCFWVFFSSLALMLQQSMGLNVPLTVNLFTQKGTLLLQLLCYKMQICYYMFSRFFLCFFFSYSFIYTFWSTLRGQALYLFVLLLSSETEELFRLCLRGQVSKKCFLHTPPPSLPSSPPSTPLCLSHVLFTA